jgi:hypothetical protein
VTPGGRARSGRAKPSSAPGIARADFDAAGDPMAVPGRTFAADHSPRHGKHVTRPRRLRSGPLSNGATAPLPLIYDFYGFPEKFYRRQ